MRITLIDSASIPDALSSKPLPIYGNNDIIHVTQFSTPVHFTLLIICTKMLCEMHCNSKLQFLSYTNHYVLHF